MKIYVSEWCFKWPINDIRVITGMLEENSPEIEIDKNISQKGQKGEKFLSIQP